MRVKELIDALSWYDDDTNVDVYISYNNGKNGLDCELEDISYESGRVVLNGYSN